MPKQSGLGWTTCSVDDAAGSAKAIVNDVTNLQISTPRGVQDVTGLDKFAYERILLLADSSVTLNGVFNPTTDASHDVFKTVTSSNVARTTTLTIASKTLASELLFTDYNLTRAQTGEFTWSAPGVLSDGTIPTWA